MTSTELGPLSTKSPLKSSTRQSQGFECKNGRITPIYMYIYIYIYIYLVIHTFIHVAMFQYTSFPGFPHCSKCIMVFGFQKYTFKRHTFKGYTCT